MAMTFNYTQVPFPSVHALQLLEVIRLFLYHEISFTEHSLDQRCAPMWQHQGPKMYVICLNTQQPTYVLFLAST